MQNFPIPGMDMSKEGVPPTAVEAVLLERIKSKLEETHG